MSLSATGKKFSEEHRRNISIAKSGCRNPNRGYVWTDSQRMAASESRKGKRAWNKGVPQTVLARVKMSESQKSRWAKIHSSHSQSQST
jgi:hypothetical protein